ncbi:hypothetical protein [Streptomyces roseifaciens]|uniref:hypothetical protein n=1 Tax=Streptomyces roseifaciens TaxID=1488406 RepID=UPI000A3F2888|nr:hypothetical protein [Streptomyces roseifaciens]
MPIICYFWPPARAVANADVAATMVTAPLLSLAVTAPLARLLRRPAITTPPPATRPRDRWRLITAITTAGVLIIVASFFAAHRFVTIAPALPADERATRCTTGRWHVHSDVHTFTIQGEKAQAVGGKGSTWHVKDHKLVLASVTNTSETRTLYLAPNKPMDHQPPKPTTTTRPEPRSLGCLHPHLVLGLEGGHEVLTAESGRNRQR